MISLGSDPLTLEGIDAFMKSKKAKVQLSVSQIAKIEASFRCVEKVLRDPDKKVYGVNTGFGSLKNIRISEHDLRALQLNLVRSHAVGVGTLLDRSIVKLILLLRVYTLARGYSGVSLGLIKRLIWMLENEMYPLIPCQGSVGASGDLAPLSHMALAVIGEAKVEWRGEIKKSSDIFVQEGLEPLELHPKEALALINGTQMMTAIGTLNWIEAHHVVKALHVACALSLEASLGSPKAFLPQVHDLKPHPGQLAVAQIIHSLLDGSDIVRSHADCDRVQDAYSLRCAAQVHGVAEEALSTVRRTLEIEMNSVTDNPLVFEDKGEFVSAGHFHGQAVAFSMDMLSMALTTMASISDRRTFRLLSSDLSDLPVALVEKAGLQSGLMMLQVTSAALASECKVLSHPSSVDSIPTWAEQEDHVSMGAHAARKNRQIVQNLGRVAAIELICAAQGILHRRPHKSSEKLESVIEFIRQSVPAVTEDRPLGEEVETLSSLLREGALSRHLRWNLGGAA